MNLMPIILLTGIIVKFEIMRVFEKPVPVEKWSQMQRIELVDDNDFVDTLIKGLK